MNFKALKRFRSLCDCNQLQMAKRLGIEQTTYGNYELGKRRTIPLNVLKSLFEMGFNVNALFSEDEPIKHNYNDKNLLTLENEFYILLGLEAAAHQWQEAANFWNNKSDLKAIHQKTADKIREAKEQLTNTNVLHYKFSTEIKL